MANEEKNDVLELDGSILEGGGQVLVSVSVIYVVPEEPREN